MSSPYIELPLRDMIANLVNHRTETYDDMGPVGSDDRWDVFGPFHDYLHAAFPLTYVLNWLVIPVPLSFANYPTITVVPRIWR